METALSKYVWELKDEGRPYEIKWNIARKAAPYKCGMRQCDVCLTEKMLIATADPETMLNNRAEIVSTCHHRAKFRLENAADDAPT